MDDPLKPQSANLLPTALSGLLVILPLAILFLVVMEVYELLEDTATFARLDLPFPGFINALIYIATVIAALFLLCLLVGYALQTRPGKRVAQFVEKSIAEKIPLLGLVRSLTLSVTGANQSKLRGVEVNLQGSGTTVLGFLMETLDDGRQVIFIPSAPAVTLGTIHIVPAERVRLLDSSVASVAGAISQWGVGTRELL